MRFKREHLKVTRDTVIFILGIAGIVHEVFLTNLDRPDILVLSMAMIGLPAFLRGDEMLFGGGEDEPNGNDSNGAKDSKKESDKRPESQEYDDLDGW